MWKDTWSQSPFFGWFIRNGLFGPFDFSDIVMLAYVFQLYFQPLLALYYTMPRIGYFRGTLKNPPAFNLVTQEAKKDDKKEEESEFLQSIKKDRVCEYQTYADSYKHDKDLTDYRSSFIVLAEATRMEAFAQQDMLYREAVASNLDMDNVDNEQDAEEYFELALTGIMRGVMRFGLKGLIQNAIQVNFQVSLVAIGISFTTARYPQLISSGYTPITSGLDGFNTFTVFLSVLGMLADSPDMVYLVRFAWRMRTQMKKWLDARREKMPADGDDFYSEQKHRYDLFKFRYVGMMIMMVLYVLFAVLALQKMFMALFVCTTEGVSNLTGCAAINITAIQQNCQQQ
jgi:hypothetical protein